MRFRVILLALFIIIAGISCQKFDPFAPLTNEQVANLLEKAKEQNPGSDAPCDTLSQQDIQTIMNDLKNFPKEPVGKKEVAVIETNYGTMVLAFNTDVAPEHCTAFKRLVKSGFYTCTKFHRIVPGFVIQGGDILTRDNNPQNDGYGNPGYSLNAEFNDLPHGAGVLSMARSQSPNSAGSQFFICLSREGTRALDGKYTVFGKVIGGLDVLDAIANVPTRVANPRAREKSYPTVDVVIKNAYMVNR